MPPAASPPRVKGRGWKIEALLLTHGHFDHIWDAGLIEADHGCPVYATRGTCPSSRTSTTSPLFGIRGRFSLS